MTVTTVGTDSAPAAIGPYSQAVFAGGVVFVSGQLGLVPETGKLADADFAAQARQALLNMQNIILAAGLALRDVASVDVFLTDMNCFSIFNEVYEDFFDAHRPSRAVAAVQALPKGALIEVKCIACKNHKR